MTGSYESGLGRRAREIVGVGASVGAGCHPCLAYHVKAAAEAGIEAPALLAAITAAERVTADASARMAQHAHRQVPGADAVTADGTVRDATLASLGAAVAANSMPSIERYLTEATDLGVSHDQLVDAVNVAHEVQANAAGIHARRTSTLLRAPQPVNQQESDHDGECDQSCPCHDDGGPDSGAGSATAVAPAEAPPAARACADAPADGDAPAADARRPSLAGSPRTASPTVAGFQPSRAMLAGCCGGPTA